MRATTSPFDADTDTDADAPHALPARGAWPRLAPFALALLAPAAQAQSEPTPQDGHWRGTLGAGLSASGGNTETTTATVNAEATRATARNRWYLNGKGLYARDHGETTGDQQHLGARYELELGHRYFASAGLDLDRDKIAELKYRISPNVGGGYRLVDRDDLHFNVFSGLGYVREAYTEPRDVDGRPADGNNYPTLIVGEDSAHQFNDTITGHQRLAVLPNLRQTGEYRVEFDSGLAFAMTKKIALNVGFTVRYDSAASDGVDKTDTLFTTGVQMKFE